MVTIIAASVAIATLVAISLFFPRTTYLVLIDDLSGEYLHHVRLNESEEFSVSFIHSVNISPVTEIFQIYEGRIVLTALEFYTFGAGMPTELESGQTLIHLLEGGMRIEGFDRVIDGLRYMPGLDTEHTLYVGTQRVSLNTLGHAGHPMRFEFISLNIWQKLVCLQT